jgi:hypothetical protein
MSVTRSSSKMPGIVGTCFAPAARPATRRARCPSPVLAVRLVLRGAIKAEDTMSILSKLFGGGKRPPEPEIYKDFRIFPEPRSGSGGYRLAARIEKDIGGETKVHHMVRADQIQSADEAEQFSRRKAQQLIDEQGDKLFE